MHTLTEGRPDGPALPRDSWWYRERRAILSRELHRLGPPGRAAHLGSADGADALHLHRHGWRTTALVTDPAAVPAVRASGVAAVAGDPCYLPLPTGAFDLAVAFDLLARVEDDHRAAAEIARVLRPGGTALIAVPQDMRLWSAHDLACGHVRRYTRDMFCALLAGAGLAIDRLWNWNVLLRPLARLRRHQVTGWETRQRRPAADRLLGWIVQAEDLLPVRSLSGTTLIARAHRPADDREPPAAGQ
ncbi:class I SAM-dependent methyltransferase [Actinomadura logoneensis]|uniref:Class I SAM-dependent methyltransferase n=1 Tax=Actinomadura logoneensis TaxID=2293572 RepID=A0A372JQB0_9ACTN|nr:class I SAM-dependent methyltransferase [Actinomadura logoneensis]RFU41954.1 class I SAM-dependent methyltransferase [Actinomadura logoneensis]